MAKHDIKPEAFTSLAGKLQGMQLDDEEQALLTTVLRLAQQQVEQAGEVEGYSVGGPAGTLNVGNTRALQQNFSNSFGPLTAGGLGAGRAPGASTDLARIRIGVVVSF